MLRPNGRDDLKFPGGGVEPGEDDESALSRELAEECGYALSAIRGHAVDTLERRPAIDRPGAVFEMLSRYYWCDVEDQGITRQLDDYEHDLGIRPEWVSIADAVKACRRAASQTDVLAWTQRELAVLLWLSTHTSATEAGAG
jgi:8-oxo-dGTP pyrophosphatase MutT (NUDIX family)